ncbi:hypothetical protein [Microbispora rosea]
MIARPGETPFALSELFRQFYDERLGGPGTVLPSFEKLVERVRDLDR